MAQRGSKRTEIEVDDDELFNIGDVFENDDMLWSINQIIDNEGRKQSSLHPAEVSVISALNTMSMMSNAVRQMRVAII